MSRPAALLALALCLALPASAAAQAPAPPPVREIAVIEKIGDTVPLDLSFTAADGGRVTLGDYFDGERPVVLALAYSRCTMLCSLVLRGVADAVRQSELDLGADYRVVTVSIDPRETPADARVLKKELLHAARRPDATGAWAFLVGEEPSIQALADSVGFSYTWDERTEQFAHPAVVFVLSPRGEIEAYVYGIQYAGGPLDRALRGGGAEPQQAGGLLSCFRFDPALRKYWGVITTFFKIGAALLFIGVGGLIGRYLWRERRAR